jgi:hypothetical protein
VGKPFINIFLFIKQQFFISVFNFDKINNYP